MLLENGRQYRPLFGTVIFMNEISVARLESVVVLMARWEAFASWWLSGLREVLPSSWLGWIDGIATPKLLMRLEGDLVVCRLASAALSTEVRMHVHTLDLRRSAHGSPNAD